MDHSTTATFYQAMTVFHPTAPVSFARGNAMDHTLDIRDLMKWEPTVKVGDIVELRWTAGSFGHFASRATVIKVNRCSVRGKILDQVDGYPLSHEIVVPFCLASMGANKWTWFNGVFPIT